MRISLFSIGALCLGTAASAATADHPCEAIMKACKAAGYHKNGHKEHKGLREDCLKPVMHGRVVPAVGVSKETVKACKAHQAQWRARHRG